MSRFNTMKSRSRLRCIAFIASAEKFFPVLFVYPQKSNKMKYFILRHCPLSGKMKKFTVFL